MSILQPAQPDRLSRRQQAAATLLVAVLLVVGLVLAHKKVTVVADGRVQSVGTYYNAAADVLRQERVVLGTHDVVRVSTPKLRDGTVIEVHRAQTVKVTVDGRTETVVSGQPTVGDLAASLGISREGIRLAPPAEEKVTAGMHVQVIRLAEKIEKREMPIPPPVVRTPDPELEKGFEEADEGEPGTGLVTFRVKLEDGKPVNEEALEDRTLTAPRAQVIRVGARDIVQTSRGDVRFRVVRWMEATAYLPTDGGGHGITYTGIPARRGVMAVDPRVIPLGSRLFIPGYGFALAADTGGAIKGDRIDLCIESPAEAWQFGRQAVKVYVLE